MKDEEKIDNYLGRTLSIVNKMKSNGEVMDSSTCSIEESNNLNNLSLDELHDSLLVHEQRMQTSQPEEQVLKVMYDYRVGTSRGRGRGNRGRGRGGRGRQSFNKALIECFQCHKLGHFQYEYPAVTKQAH